MKNNGKLCLQIGVASYGFSSFVLVLAYLALPKLQERNLALIHIAAMVMAAVLALYNYFFPFLPGMTKKRIWLKRMVLLALANVSLVGTNGLLGALPIRPVPHLVGFLAAAAVGAVFYALLDLRERRMIADINRSLAAQPSPAAPAEWKYNDNVKN